MFFKKKAQLPESAAKYQCSFVEDIIKYKLFDTRFFIEKDTIIIAYDTLAVFVIDNERVQSFNTKYSVLITPNKEVTLYAPKGSTFYVSQLTDREIRSNWYARRVNEIVWEK